MSDIIDRVKTIIDKSPYEKAIEYGSIFYSYSDLYKSYSYIAEVINNYIFNERKVVVFSDRDIFTVVSLLAIFNLNKIFIPLDIGYPENRKQSILRQVKPHLVLVLKDKEENAKETILHAGIKCKILSFNQNLDNFTIYKFNNEQNITNEDDVTFDNDIGYINFTSGSTGQPKGILGSSKGLLHFIEWEINEFSIDQTQKISQLTSPSFDPYYRDALVALCSGATLCIPPDSEILVNSQKLIRWLDKSCITCLHIVPTLFRSILEDVNFKKPFKSLKYIFLAGELLKGYYLAPYKNKIGSKVEIINLYGPTETTLAKIYHRVKSSELNADIIPIGRPIPDVNVLVIGEHDKIIDSDGMGEIVIGTKYCSHGYLNDIELTKRKFISDPLGLDHNTKYYRTGDYCQISSHGVLYCLGRRDRQVKINGQRIELSEIEFAMMQINGIKEVVVKTAEINNVQVLSAFYIASIKLVQEEIVEKLMNTLPIIMIPVVYTELSSFPTLPNGKIDYKLLCINDDNPISNNPMGNMFEEIVIEKFKIALNTDCVNYNSSFFLLGGNSIRASQLILSLNEALSIRLSHKDIFKYSSPRCLSEYITSLDEVNQDDISILKQANWYPVSSEQKRLLLLDYIDHDCIGTTYNLTEAFLLLGSLNLFKLEKSLSEIVERHETLRTIYRFNSGEAFQKICSHQDFKVKLVDIDKPLINIEKVPNKKHIQLLIQNSIKPFSLYEKYHFRVTIYRYSDSEILLIWDTHHIACDAISLEILKNEICKLYNDEQVGNQDIRYIDYASWSKNNIQTEKYEELKSYWKSVFSKEIPAIELPLKAPRKTRKDYKGLTYSLILNKDLKEKIDRLSYEQNCTPFMFYLSIFSILISRYTNQEDLIIGIPVSKRNHVKLSSIVGTFINNIIIRCTPQHNKSFLDYLLEIKKITLEAIENSDFQFESLVEMLQVKRDLSRNLIFDIFFNYLNFQFNEFSIKNIETINIDYDNHTSKFDLSLIIVERNSEIHLLFEYDSTILSKKRIKQLANHYINILDEVTQKTTCSLSEINVLSEKEKNMIIRRNHTYMRYSCDSILQMFLREVLAHPNRIAIQNINYQISYHELNMRSTALAEIMLHNNIGVGDFVCILFDRTPDLFVSILSVIKIGAVYIPLDPEYPVKRLKTMIDDCQARVILTKKDIYTKLELEYPALFISELNEKRTVHNFRMNNPCNSQLLYVIYTSGSTGNPKGVKISHGNIKNFMHAMDEALCLEKVEKIISITTVCFDIFVLESIIPLVYGKTIVLANEEQQLNPRVLIQLLHKTKADFLQVTPSRLEMLLKYIDSESLFKYISKVIIGGEVLYENLIEKIFYKEDLEIDIYNMYGPTETTVWSTYKKLSRGKKVTIGKPIANTQIYILNKQYQIVPIGVTGDLYIGGEGLSEGYLNFDELTNMKFIDNPFSPSSKIYNTGDQAKILDDGDIEFVGRNDFQVKIRGYRIELSEIERVMLEAGCVQAVCVKRKIRQTEEIIGYYITDSTTTIDNIELREYLKHHLPNYMIPYMFIEVDDFPYTQNGKIDRSLLPELKHEAIAKEKEEIQLTTTESFLRKLLIHILNREEIGIHNNFFDIGGNSLRVVQLFIDIEDRYPGIITVADIFSNPSISKLAYYIDNKKTTLSPNISLIEMLPTYYIGENDNVKNIIGFDIDRQDFSGINNYCQKVFCDIFDVLLATFAYAVYENSIDDKIELLIVTSNGSFQYFKYNFNLIETFEQCVVWTQRQLQNERYDKKILDKTEAFIKNKLPLNSLVPIFNINSMFSLNNSRIPYLMLSVKNKNNFYRVELDHSRNIDSNEICKFEKHYRQLLKQI